MSKLLMELKMKWNEWKGKLKRAFPSWFKSAWVVLGSLMVCAIIGEVGRAILGQESGSGLHLLLNIVAGAWAYSPVNKLLGKLVRR